LILVLAGLAILHAPAQRHGTHRWVLKAALIPCLGGARAASTSRRSSIIGQSSLVAYEDNIADV
jgi:hypothetical protein